jgi:hypothetical protein
MRCQAGFHLCVCNDKPTLVAHWLACAESVIQEEEEELCVSHS